jgi:hypothetical protein
MKTFQDNAGRTWTLSVNIATVRRVRDILGVDLLDIDEGDLFTKLADNPILLGDILFVLIKPEAEKLGISDEDFGYAMGGDAFEAASDALMVDLIDFFPTPKRNLLKKVLQKAKVYQDKLGKQADAQIEAGELDKIFEKIIQGDGGNSSTNVLGQSA